MLRRKFIIGRRLNSFSTIPFTRKKPSSLNEEQLPSFLSFAQNYLEYVEGVYRPLIALNSGMRVERTSHELLIDTGLKGKFKFKIIEDRETLQVISPQSGVISYYFCHDTAEWLSTKDNHDLRGLVTRDWLRFHTGCPQFD